ncbi:MAG: ABC transporter ATP-binding protein [Planctomycetota bacterium]|nr:ABC transporter ATP-binding protein [Planctomycetota bacterium]
MAIAEFKDLRKTYQMGSVVVQALRGVSISIERGEYCSIMGQSGSGKSTLLNLLGCLDRPTSGQYFLGGEDVSQMNDDELSAVRSISLGFIFQSYNLIPQLTVLENIEVPLFYQGIPWKARRSRSAALADLVGLSHRLNHRPMELSGGQQQRVAIARALVNEPLVILADEPTGNLDSTTGEEILAILQNLHEEGKTIITVTHDESVARQTQRIIWLSDGEVQKDERV